ncbi:Qat anti-phage system QueC-like protein QatC [Coraliomargarita algicola]|uniref:Qat anti-phage system QueC-like protein QatC n=1 Tax=Coraliomargarita algicola TaxID=3092156 RepID=A0ABZ0RG30_9BACT|nr:Qat anti-phage system QueC-like protein QatC [Coraliomargarita sp. J2-16]WPJ95129.1 Qat anti-phage system QueC-like protein QatC [Coraliomargarita sp. J2-16]
MFRHHIVFQMNNKDRFQVTPDDPHSVVSNVDLYDILGLLNFGIQNTIDAVKELALSPSEIAFDLLLLGTAVMGVDTRISRAKNAQDGWTREIFLYFPVSDPGLWQAQAGALSGMLHFLTGDRWCFQFRPRPKAKQIIVPVSDKFNLAPRDCVSLLSGGLDSCIGAIDLLTSGREPIFVSHYSDGTTRTYQRIVLDALKQKYGKSSFDSLRGNLGFPRNILHNGGDEGTQRSRSFLFFSLAAYVADGSSGDTLIYLPENGLISLNVPLDSLRLGALGPRTAHPYYVARWNELLGAIGLSGRLLNPYATQTKGQMIRDCKDLHYLKELLPQTMSCSSPAKARWDKHAPRHCGYCMPCLIRRASTLFGLDYDGDTTEYGVELKGQVLNSKKAEGAHVRAAKSTIAKLQANPKYARLAIFKSGPLTDVGDQLEDYVAVYQNGMNEIAELLKTTNSRPI